MQQTAFFAGSFNPYTVGHHDLVCRALHVFDNVVIGVGFNADKADVDDVDARVRAIEEIYVAEPRVQVVSYDGLTIVAARMARATALLRGVRNVRDFEYERDLADVNLRISGIETVLLTTRPEFAAVSSSVVRDLQRHGYPVDKFLPKPLTSPLI